MTTNILTAVITAYCCCAKCTKGTGKTANGKIPTQGITIAASRSLPFGTKVVTSYGVYEVQDRLAKRYDSRFDIYFDSHEKAKQFGIKRNQQVKVITP